MGKQRHPRIKCDGKILRAYFSDLKGSEGRQVNTEDLVEGCHTSQVFAPDF